MCDPLSQKNTSPQMVWCPQRKSLLFLQEREPKKKTRKLHYCRVFIRLKCNYWRRIKIQELKPTCIYHKRSKAKPSAINFPKDRTQLSPCITPVVMVSQHCITIQSHLKPQTLKSRVLYIKQFWKTYRCTTASAGSLQCRFW